MLMQPSSLASSFPFRFFLLLCLLASISQLQAAEVTASNALTEHGYPNLQGYWTNPYLTPLQRPVQLGLQSTYTEEQALELISRTADMDRTRQAPLEGNRAAPPVGGIIDQQADGNFELMPTEIARVNNEYRTSLIVSPPNGRMPILETASDIFDSWFAQGFEAFDGPEIRPIGERCLSPGAQLPLLTTFGGATGGNPGGDNPVRNIQIVQSKNHIVILSEYNSLVRIIRLSDDHLEEQGPKWMGDSIARYQDDELILHTTNFRPEQSNAFVRSSDQLEVSETYKRISTDEILLTITVSDPKIFSQAFTAEIPLRRMAPEKLLYEYACHEGNYSLASILRAARMSNSD